MGDLSIEFDPRAERDVISAVQWYDQQQHGLGDRFAEKLDDLLERIVSQPRSYRRIASGVRRGLLRQFPYAVYYELTNSSVRVVAVLHTSRRPNFWKDR